VLQGCSPGPSLNFKAAGHDVIAATGLPFTGRLVLARWVSRGQPPATEPGPGPPGPSVSSRLLALLDLFSADRPQLSLSEISRLAGMPLSTAHRLVGELSDWGALERGGDGRYRIGLKIWELGSLAPRGLPLRELALPVMEDLYEATHENVQLSVLEGGGAIFVERLAGRTAVRTLVRVGGRFAIHATAGGLVLLAHAPQELQDEVLHSDLEAFTEKTVTDPVVLRRMLAEIRKREYSLSDRQVTMDAISIGAPIYGPRDQVIAALSLVVAYAGSRPRELVPLVRAGARGISRLLGSPRAGRSMDVLRLPESESSQ
jgi:DNA-binding IclR family transcriptional regulator